MANDRNLTNPPVTCNNCKNGEWFDFEPGDTLQKCPFCDKQNVQLVER